LGTTDTAGGAGPDLMIERRMFLMMITGGVLAAPHTAEAQPASRVYDRQSVDNMKPIRRHGWARPGWAQRG
ncbi:MAG: hypothetical protein ACREJS_14545, partial [Candidatus Rokuibacteriota bacterium]